jgi:hypothetical protein
MLSRRSLALTGFMALLARAGAGAALAQEVVRLRADLVPTQTVPPARTLAIPSGWGDITFDPATRKMTYSLFLLNLSSPTGGASFHGPAMPGQNAPAVVPIALSGGNTLKGEVVLSEAQAADLMAYRWYINVHTSMNPAGELRGYVVR